MREMLLQNSVAAEAKLVWNVAEVGNRWLTVKSFRWGAAVAKMGIEGWRQIPVARLAISLHTGARHEPNCRSFA